MVYECLARNPIANNKQMYSIRARTNLLKNFRTLRVQRLDFENPILRGSSFNREHHDPSFQY